MTALLQCIQLVKIYRVPTSRSRRLRSQTSAGSEVMALQGLDLAVEAGEIIGVVGASGSGKSTLLTMISGLTRPTGGQVYFDGLELGQASRRQLDDYRRNDVGFLWQNSANNLVPYLSTLDNVALPLAAAGRAKARDHATEVLSQVGMSNRLGHRPYELSGGEQQRVALAVALAHGPRLLLADEPTGELDQSTTESVFELMREIGTASGLTQIVVSHDAEVTRHVDRVVSINDGRVASERRMTSVNGRSETIEVAMLDSIGRLQLTEEQRTAVGSSGRVHAELVDGELRIRASTAHLETPDG